MRLGRIWDFVMRRKLVCAVFAAIIVLIFLVIFNIVQHISSSGSIQGWFSGEASVSYLNLPCYETDAGTSGGENRTTEDSTTSADDSGVLSDSKASSTEQRRHYEASEENGETDSDQPKFQVNTGQIFGLIIGLIFVALLIRFCFDHFVR